MKKFPGQVLMILKKFNLRNDLNSILSPNKRNLLLNRPKSQAKAEYPALEPIV